MEVRRLLSAGVSAVSLVQQTCSTESFRGRSHADLLDVPVKLDSVTSAVLINANSSQRVALRFPTLCPSYQASDPQVIERQCHEINSYTVGHCFPGNGGREGGEQGVWDGVIKRGEEEEG